MTPAYRDTALLFSRAGFGALHSEIERYESWPWERKVNLVTDLSRAPAEVGLPDLNPNRDWYDRWVDMVHFWLDRARRPVNQAPLQEKMVLFWHGLFTSGLQKVGNHQIIFDQHRLFRRHALGNFQTLAWQASISPAMLVYLDNRFNEKDEVNENFARELMELFTLGVGHYNEDDVRAASRAWTGYGAEWPEYRYQFFPNRHDSGSKTFLGRTGNWNGEDIINLIVNERRQAHSRFFCRKLWSFFAYPVDLDAPEVSDIMGAYSDNLSVRAAVRAIFLHPAFRSQRSRQGLVRSPIEYAVAVMRHAKLTCSQARPEWYLKSMGQTPFDPPNVSGWRQNEYWISESATWAKGAQASYVRWRTYDRGDLEAVNDVVSYNPRTYRIGIDQAVDGALDNYDLRLTSAQTRRALTDYVKTERNSENSWGQRAGLLYLPLMSPEMQLA